MSDELMPPRPDNAADPDILALPARLDLRALDPSWSGAPFDATARSIAADAMTERLRLQRATASISAGQRSLLSPLAAWSLPAFAAAAAIVLIAGAALLLLPVPAVAAPNSLAESAGIPGPMVEWATSNRSPSAAEVIDAFDAAAVAAARGVNGRMP